MDECDADWRRNHRRIELKELVRFRCDLRWYGSQLISKEILAKKDFEALEKTVCDTMSLIKKLKC